MPGRVASGDLRIVFAYCEHIAKYPNTVSRMPDTA